MFSRECKNLQKVDCSHNDISNADGLSKSVLHHICDKRNKIMLIVWEKIFCVLCVVCLCSQLINMHFWSLKYSF